MIYRFFKRLFDIFVSLLALPFVLLVILIFAPIIFLTDRGPVFYNAPRLGRKGKVFKMFKLRSMKVNSPNLKAADGSTYNAAGRCPRYIERAVDSAFTVAMSDERPATICYVYNPLNAMSSMRNSYLACGLTSAANDITARARRIAVPLIRKTAEKASIFRKPDGSFSMTPDFSSPNSQMMPVALPSMREGDINATTIAINGVFGGVSGALAYGIPKLYDDADFRDWLAMIASVTEVKKRPIPEGTVIKYYNPV